MPSGLPKPRLCVAFRLVCGDGAEANVTCSTDTNLQRLVAVQELLEAGNEDELLVVANLELAPLVTEDGVPIADTLFFVRHMLGGDLGLARVGEPKVTWVQRSRDRPDWERVTSIAQAIAGLEKDYQS